MIYLSIISNTLFFCVRLHSNIIYNKNHIDSLHSQKPDRIIITEDVANPVGTVKSYQELLSEIKAPLGDYFVQGNWEYWETVKQLGQIFKKKGILDLTIKHHLIKDNVWLMLLSGEH